MVRVRRILFRECTNRLAVGVSEARLVTVFAGEV